ncbi:MAG: TRAP transporter large permease subunit, partial [Gemmatimonadetes bacterium]|nr:TRAP transporter large permease subunit [Gemmatimonadota bacterium]
MRAFLVVVAAAATLFHLYSAGISPFTALIQRPSHLAFMAALGFLGFGQKNAETSAVRRAISLVLTVVAAVTSLYIVFEQDTLVARSGNPTTVDLVMGALALIAVLELARRTTGTGLVVVALGALAYAFLGPWLPGVLAHRGYGVRRLVEHLYLSTEGIWGIPLGVSADFVFLFVLFGAVLEVAGGGALLIALAERVAGRSRGGPAKTAAVASAFMGSLSGSAVANVVTTGTFTIPLMQRAG